MHGRVLDVGCGPYKCFPHFIGVDNGHHWGTRGADVVAEATDLSLFADKSCDTVYSSHLLEHIEYYKFALKEWWRVVKPNGYLCLYLPHKLFYPNIGQFGANPDHKHDFIPEDIISAMEEIGGWDLLENEDRNGDDEYSFWQVYQKIGEKQTKHSWKLPKPTKTCAIVRYGAIGDMIQMSSILPGLKEQGYHITLYCQAGPGYDVIKSDPHIDRFIIQGRDEVPPLFLKEFWDYTQKKYSKWINLCESVEGTLLASPGRTTFEWPNHLRAKYLDRNYLEWTHELAEVPPPYNPKFYSTPAEKVWAKEKARSYGRKNILWSLSGSSGHKVWPHLDTIIARIMLTWRDVDVVTVGDDFCKIIEYAWEKEKRVHKFSGVWTIRETLAFAEVADVVIGTETGVLNAAGSMNATKIITLSHSSENMLTKHWKNTIALNQPQGVGCPKHPCRQLHGGGNTDPWIDCPREEEHGTALCQFHVDPEMMWAAVVRALGESERRAA